MKKTVRKIFTIVPCVCLLAVFFVISASAEEPTSYPEIRFNIPTWDSTRGAVSTDVTNSTTHYFCNVVFHDKNSGWYYAELTYSNSNGLIGSDRFCDVRSFVGTNLNTCVLPIIRFGSYPNSSTNWTSYGGTGFQFNVYSINGSWSSPYAPSAKPSVMNRDYPDYWIASQYTKPFHNDMDVDYLIYINRPEFSQAMWNEKVVYRNDYSFLQIPEDDINNNLYLGDIYINDTLIYHAVNPGDVVARVVAGVATVNGTIHDNGDSTYSIDMDSTITFEYPPWTPKDDDLQSKIDDYNEIENNIPPFDGDLDLSDAGDFSDGMAFWKNRSDEFFAVFTNVPVMSLFLFAMSMGIVVLILNRRIR